MSFLVSFNGQYSAYVYKTDPSQSVKINPIAPVQDFKTELVQAQGSPEDDAHGARKTSVVRAYEQQVKLFETKKLRIHAKDIMKPQIIISLDSARIQDVAHPMLDEKINALPVVSFYHKLVGIITLNDMWSRWTDLRRRNHSSSLALSQFGLK